MKRTVAEVVAMTGGTLAQGQGEQKITGVCTDSRKISAGNLYIPLVGETFDGHQFAVDVAAKGAAAMLWAKDRELPNVACPVIVVADTLGALQALSHAYRKQLQTKVVAITGSNGKTSTKDMIAQVLSESFRVQKTFGNLNNHIGVPLTLLALEENTEVAVIEMGMNHYGEIQLLAEIAEPDFGVITNIGESHIEFFGSRSGIATAKWELIDQLGAGTTAVLNGDEPLLRERSGRFAGRICWFGLNPENDVHPVQLQRHGLKGYSFQLADSKELFHLPVLGEHQVSNALAAIAVARALEMNDATIARGLANVQLTPMRMQVIESTSGWTIVNDAYNASPTSMKAAFHMIGQLPDVYKVAVLGDMLELGGKSAELHKETGQAAVLAGIDELFCMGEHSRFMVEGAVAEGLPKERAQWFPDLDSLLSRLQSKFGDRKDVVVLVKGSRGMRMERVAQALSQVVE